MDQGLQLQRRGGTDHLGHRVYSPAQLSIAQLFANWMQASYLPKGALGDVLQFRNAKLSPYNQNTAAYPNSYGAFAKLYAQLMYGANKKIEPLTSDSMIWGMEANGFYGEPLATISTPERAYLTLPTFEEQGHGPELDKAAGVSSHPVLKQFPTLFVRNSSTGNQRLIVLTKDHRHPFVTVTKGEYLQALEAAVMRKYADETQKIARDNKGNQKSIDYFMGYLNRYHEKRVAVLSSNKEKYKARLQETAEIWTEEPGVLLENYRRCVRRQRRRTEAVARLHDRSPHGRTRQDRRASVDHHVLDGALERPGQPEPAQFDLE